jgi:hypothetical protein
MVEAKFSWILERAEGTTALVRFYELQVQKQRRAGVDPGALQRRLICERQLAFSHPVSRRELAAAVNNLARRVVAERRMAVADADYIAAK